MESKYELAMILPLPVKRPSGEEDVRFINLKEYPNFFWNLRAGFPAPPSASEAESASMGSARAKSSLKVYGVGDFEASFVPTVEDFPRLDPKFQLPKEAWSKLPAYQSYGFAVFKLKHGAHTIHPMAFSFTRHDSKSLFFPTVHIHDGKVHPNAIFDHVLYCQPGATQLPSLVHWRESYTQAKNFVDIKKSLGIIEGPQHCYQKELKGNLPNQDVILKMT